MKNFGKVLVMTLLVGLFGVVAVSSLLADSTVATPISATTSYNATTGIRWNQGFGVFEVFNAAGVSYIGSNASINAQGNIDVGGVTADGNKTYHIMQDIAYSTDNLEPNFASGTRYSIDAGVVNGRGFTLKNFPIIATAEAGTALFRSNNGAIQDIKLLNPTYASGTSDTGIICNTNNGTIDNCVVDGIAINLSTSVINIASIAYTGNGTIRNCTNKLDLTTRGQFSAGIIGNAENPIIFNCLNLGNISSTVTANRLAGGIAAFLTQGTVHNNINYGNINSLDAGGILGNCDASRVSGNKNYGEITGINTACGIVGGIVYGFDAPGNEHHGVLLGAAIKQPFFATDGLSNYGISFDSDNNIFEITNMIGLTFVGSGKSFSASGAMVSEGTAGSGVASTSATYHIVNDIVYSTDNVYTREPLTINGAIKLLGMKPDGGDGTVPVSLTNFPIRQIGTSGTFSALFASIAKDAAVENIYLSIDDSVSPGGTTGVFSYINNGKVKNCEVSGTIDVGNIMRDIGGFAYTNSDPQHNTRFENCTNRMSITSRAAYLAGIMSVSDSSRESVFIDCVNEGELTSRGTLANMRVGGISSQVATGYYERCINKANLTVDSNSTGGVPYLGGISGNSNRAQFFQCENQGVLSFTPPVNTNNLAVGGCIGWGGVTILIVDFVGTSTSGIVWNGPDKLPRIGGVAGFIRGSIDSFGTVTSQFDPSLSASYTHGSILLNCVFEGSINIKHATSTAYGGVGGILGTVGFQAEGLVHVVSCEMKGTVNLEDFDATPDLVSSLYAGGIIGSVIFDGSGTRGLTVKDCTNSSDLELTYEGSFVGGIIGYAAGGALSITSSGNTNDGDIVVPESPSTNTGKFAGYIENSSLTTLTCGGTGSVSSGLIVGNLGY